MVLVYCLLCILQYYWMYVTNRFFLFEDVSQEFDGASASAEDVFTQLFPVTERKKRHYVHLNTTKFNNHTPHILVS